MQRIIFVTLIACSLNSAESMRKSTSCVDMEVGSHEIRTIDKNGVAAVSPRRRSSDGSATSKHLLSGQKHFEEDAKLHNETEDTDELAAPTSKLQQKLRALAGVARKEQLQFWTL